MEPIIVVLYDEMRELAMELATRTNQSVGALVERLLRHEAQRLLDLPIPEAFK